MYFSIQIKKIKLIRISRHIFSHLEIKKSTICYNKNQKKRVTKEKCLENKILKI